MSGSSGRQGREFPLEGLVEGVGGRKRTRRLNRRERRHLASESSLSRQDHTVETMGRKAAVSQCSTCASVNPIGQFTPVDWEDVRDASWR